MAKRRHRAPEQQLAGRRFGRLLVTGMRLPANLVCRSGHNKLWLCLCDCGETRWVATSKLTAGHTKSCGCWKSDFRKLPSGMASRNQLLDEYRRGAARRGHSFELSAADFFDLVIRPCCYCGSLRENTKKARRHNGEFKYTGIDRVDNRSGYVNGNVVACCKKCNVFKQVLPVDQFLDHALKIAAFQRQLIEKVV